MVNPHTWPGIWVKGLGVTFLGVYSVLGGCLGNSTIMAEPPLQEHHLNLAGTISVGEQNANQSKGLVVQFKARTPRVVPDRRPSPQNADYKPTLDALPSCHVTAGPPVQAKTLRCIQYSYSIFKFEGYRLGYRSPHLQT